MPRAATARESARQEPVQDRGALAAADDEDAQPPLLRSRDEGRNLEERGPDGIARHDRAGQRRRAARGSDRDPPRELARGSGS